MSSLRDHTAQTTAQTIAQTIATTDGPNVSRAGEGSGNRRDRRPAGPARAAATGKKLIFDPYIGISPYAPVPPMSLQCREPRPVRAARVPRWPYILYTVRCIDYDLYLTHWCIVRWREFTSKHLEILADGITSVCYPAGVVSATATGVVYEQNLFSQLLFISKYRIKSRVRKSAVQLFCQYMLRNPGFALSSDVVNFAMRLKMREIDTCFRHMLYIAGAATINSRYSHKFLRLVSDEHVFSAGRLWVARGGDRRKIEKFAYKTITKRYARSRMSRVDKFALHECVDRRVRERVDDVLDWCTALNADADRYADCHADCRVDINAGMNAGDTGAGGAGDPGAGDTHGIFDGGNNGNAVGADSTAIDDRLAI